MTRALALAARAGLSAALFLLVLAVARWPPFHAEPPWDVRALPTGGLAVILAVAASLGGRRRRVAGIAPLLLGALLVAAALGAVVAARPATGLSALSAGPDEARRVPPGPIAVTGRQLELQAPRRSVMRWSGALRAPESGVHRFWVGGRGRVVLRIDGHTVLDAEADPLVAGADLPLLAGEHRIEVTLERMGPGPRLRVGWTRPGGFDEVIPPRYLGQAAPAWTWWLTDALALVLAALVAALAWIIPWDAPRPLSSPAAVTRRELAWSLAGHAALVTLMSWPLALDLAGSSVTDRPDGRLNAWILAWDVHALLHEPLRLFQAPIFHPLPDALAFSENLLVPAILAAPAVLLGGPVLGYNLVLLGSLVVSGLGAQLLVRRVSGDRLAAFIGGAVFAVGAHRWIRLAHLHAQVTLFLPFALLAFDRFWERRSLRRALAVGSLLALQALASVYLGAITALALAAALVAGVVAGLRRRELLRVAAGFALAAFLVAPVVRPYLRMRAQQGIEWTQQDVAAFATNLDSYAASGTRLWGPLTQRLMQPGQVRDTLFPGLVPLVLGLVGLASAPRRYRAVAVLASVAAVVFSLGPETALYRFLHEHVVLVRGVRALSRFSLVPVLALSVLTGVALAGRWRLALLSLPAMLLEAGNAPLRFDRYPGPPAAALWLAGKPGAVVQLPLGEDDTRAMLDGVAHFRPLVNGDSGFVPRPYARARELLSERPWDERLRFLRALGVSHVLSRDEAPLPALARFDATRVYAVPAGDSAVVVGAAASRPTLWTAAGPMLDLGALSRVSGVGFELDDRPWLASPALEISIDARNWRSWPATASLADAALTLYREPRHGRGELRFPEVPARYLRLDPALPARPGALSAEVR